MLPLSLQPIRDAISSGELERARLLWDCCAAELAKEFESGVRQARLEELRALIEWTRTVSLCDRAHRQDEIQRLKGELHVAFGYHFTAPERTVHVAARF
jgi:hypothetical protein